MRESLRYDIGMVTEPARTDGMAIRRYRKQRGLRINQLAEQLGVTPQHVANIEKGRRQGSPPLVLSIATALNVPIEEITADAAPLPNTQSSGADIS